MRRPKEESGPPWTKAPLQRECGERPDRGKFKSLLLLRPATQPALSEGLAFLSFSFRVCEKGYQNFQCPVLSKSIIHDRGCYSDDFSEKVTEQASRNCLSFPCSAPTPTLTPCPGQSREHPGWSGRHHLPLADLLTAGAGGQHLAQA